MQNFWRIISTNKDSNGLEFISMLEAKHYPFWGVQYHPEKNNFEVHVRGVKKEIPHSGSAVRVSFDLAFFFVDQCRKNNHQFPDIELEKVNLIYNYDGPTYTGVWGFWAQETYLFAHKRDLNDPPEP